MSGSLSENKIWSTYGWVLTVKPEPSDVMGAAVVLWAESEAEVASVDLTVGEALLLASMLTESVREVVQEVIT